MSINRWEKIEEALIEFKSYFNDSFPALKIQNVWDESWTPKEWEQFKNPKGFSRSLRGVYLFFNDSDELIYIGVATYASGKRMNTHKFKYKYADIIPFTNEFIYFSLALEHFLILKFQPQKNDKLKKDHI